MRSEILISGVDKPVSEITLGSAWFSLRNREMLFDLMDHFKAQGGTTIDTARGYGESEQVIGLWMSSRANRDEMFIISKGGLSKEDPCSLEVNEFERKTESDIKTSLRCLQTDYIDLYLLHRDAPSLPVERIVNFLNEQKELGRILSFGGSNWEPRRVDEANEYAYKHGMAGFSAVSNNLSLAKPTGPYYPGLVSVDESSRCWHMRTGIPLFSWSSLARGFFTGRFRPEVRDNPNMVRVYYTEENFKRLERAKRLGEIKGGYSAGCIRNLSVTGERIEMTRDGGLCQNKLRNQNGSGGRK
jgi:aryl-alcohol dehydrogenase-like predicted oxidoreductase